jgi:hypothetical protein
VPAARPVQQSRRIARCGGFFHGRAGQKKARSESGLETIILEENSGDRCNYAASPDIRPIAVFDNHYRFIK